MNATTRLEALAAATVADPRWAAVQARDKASDGCFVYSVRTTGVYCRPSCAARPARPENVAFHATPEAARAAGFRACRRCRPDAVGAADPQAEIVATLCREIESADAAPSLEALSQRAGLSPWHLHRVFKRVTGLTPRAYAQAHRAARVRRELARGASVTAAVYDAGYASSGRFYAEAGDVLGMTPSAWRDGGRDTEIAFAVGECALGAILVARSARGIVAIGLGDDPTELVRDLEDRFPQARLVGGDADFERLVARVVGFVEAPAIGLDLPLDVRGTAFQHRVWRALRDIPAGGTATYGEIARRIGAPRAARAVASACGANPVAVAIPCHRVVRDDGGLGGYRWGLGRKRALLARESNK